MERKEGGVRLRRSTSALLVVVFLAMGVVEAQAGARDQARRIHDRLAGVPPSEAVLDQMEMDILQNDAIRAAYRAMEDPSFYNVTLKNFAAPWTNREESAFVPLNDYIATVIGMIRDDVPFNGVLSEDILYVGASGLSGVPAYSMSSNAHYEALERGGFNLGSPSVLVATTQSAQTDLAFSGIAGVMTTRAAAEAFFVAGTNRAMLRFTLMSHMCRDLEQFFDTELPTDRIRQDVSRSPGGDSRVYLNNCIGCHTGMDPLAQAFAYHDYDEEAGRIRYTPGQVQSKYFNNEDTFPFGYVTPDDRWDNYWRSGRNAQLGWNGATPGSGHGAASMGMELSSSQAFAQCQVEKVFSTVCLRPPANADDRAQVNAMVGGFVSGDYRMKQVFAESAVYCKGD
ncbi:MAG: hypothetical protein JJT88_07700 [Gammaproteobacteria bacterium]|nr:hypothetical protein [Gammaproteobacteria bacterium]